MLSIIRQAIRSLRLSPAFTLTVIATLGIGIGLNAAIFTVVDNVLLKPLGYHDADRIVTIGTRFNTNGRFIPRLGGDDYVDLTQQVKGLGATAQYQSDTDGFSLNGVTTYAPISLATSGFTNVLGVQPVAGRGFHSGDDQAKDVLLSESFARDHYASAAAAIGQPITYAGAIYTVAGVLPQGFDFPEKPSAWFQVPVRPGNRTSYNNRVVGKRRADVSAATLTAEIATFSAHLSQTFVEDSLKTVTTKPLQEQLVGSLRPTLNLLMGSVAVILLIVVTNITHLQLVRSTRLLGPVTIRTALGATRGILARAALIETTLLAIAGTALALLLALPAIRILAAIAPQNLPRLADIHLNLDVFAFSLVVSFLLMAASALLPLWHSWHIDPAQAMRSNASRGTESRRTHRLRSGFAIAEVALTLMLSVAALLLTRQLIAQSHQNLGFETTHLLTLDTHAVIATPLPVAKDQTPAALAAQQARQDVLYSANLLRLQSVIATVAATPGVASAAAISGAPLGFGGSNVGYAIEGKSTFTPGLPLPNGEIRPITPGFFATLGIPLLRGRELNAQDTLQSPRVTLINQALANATFPGEDPIGRRMHCGFEKTLDAYTIVGVVADIRAEAPGLPATPTFYVPATQHPLVFTDMQIVARTALPPAAMKSTLEARLAATHPEIAVKITTMQENLAEVQLSDRFRTLLFGSFAGISILLAAIGMYGVTAYSVAQRRFEYSLRIALGANRPQLLGLVLKSGLRMAAIGIAVGMLLSLSLQRVLTSLLGKLPAFDPVAYTLAALAVLAIALLATLIPARRAAGVDPMQALRSE